MKKAIFFDRDGTLIVDKGFLNDPDGIEYLPGVFQALRLLRDEGYIFVVATNQSGIARGLVTMNQLDAIHAKLRRDFARHGIYFDGFYYAPFPTTWNHRRRKPNPGMIENAAADIGIDLQKSWMVGDRMTDVEAGHRAGCRSILLFGYEEPSRSDFDAPEAYLPNLLAVADFIKKNTP